MSNIALYSVAFDLLLIHITSLTSPTLNMSNIAALLLSETFLLITSLIFNGFSIKKSFGKLRLRAFQPYHQILCILKIIMISDVSDINSITALSCT